MDGDEDFVPRMLPLPPGTYSVLPLVQACDNLTLPTGPWDDTTLRQRAIAAQAASKRPFTNDSAIADEDDDVASGSGSDEVEGDEFLVPFFLELPPTTSPFPTPPSPSRTRSSSRASFTRLTPLPTLRSSSPTPSYSRAQPSSTPTAAPWSQPIGFLRPAIVQALAEDNARMVSMSCRPVWAFRPPLDIPTALPPRPLSRRSSSRTPSRRGSELAPMSAPVEEKPFVLEEVMKTLRSIGTGAGTKLRTYAVAFEDWVGTGEEGAPDAVRKEHMDRIARGWKMSGNFHSVLGGWRDEMYPVYAPAPKFDPENPLPINNVAFEMERSACALFGVATFGVHLTGYVEEPNGSVKIWVPRRAASKQTWPSMLDNTVAGGITSGDTPYESILRECEEEASLPSSYVRRRLRSASVVSYVYKTKDGWIQPEVQYCYDLQMDKGVTPKVNDGEVEGFELLGVEEVVRRMCEEEFKPNCSLVLIDFFLRHGFLTPESDSRFLEVVTRLRRSLTLPGPA